MLTDIARRMMFGADDYEGYPPDPEDVDPSPISPGTIVAMEMVLVYADGTHVVVNRQPVTTPLQPGGTIRFSDVTLNVSMT